MLTNVHTNGCALLTRTIAAGRAANISTLFAVHDIFFVNGKGLRSDWRQAWTALSAELEPLIEDRAVTGFFVGDELFPGKITLADFKVALGALGEAKAKYPWLVVWENEGGTGWVDQFKDGGVPPELDLISMDDYYMGSSPQAEADGHRAFYEKSIYPLLHPHQKVLLVPGSFATHDPRAAGDGPKGYPRGNSTYCFEGTFTGCDEYMAKQAQAFATWASEVNYARLCFVTDGALSFVSTPFLWCHTVRPRNCPNGFCIFVRNVPIVGLVIRRIRLTIPP